MAVPPYLPYLLIRSLLTRMHAGNYSPHMICWCGDKVSRSDDNGVGRAGLVPLRDGGSKGCLRYFQPGNQCCLEYTGIASQSGTHLASISSGISLWKQSLGMLFSSTFCPLYYSHGWVGCQVEWRWIRRDSLRQKGNNWQFYFYVIVLLLVIIVIIVVLCFFFLLCFSRYLLWFDDSRRIGPMLSFLRFGTTCWGSAGPILSYS